MQAQYFVIISDMVQSRALTDRQKAQNAFKAALANVQKQYRHDVISPFTLTIGDEFQAVLGNASHFFAMINQLEEDLPEIRFRYGLGVGTMSTALNRKAAIGMDGPAFHFARQALEYARQQKRCFVFNCVQPEHTKRVDLLFHWIDVTTGRWSNDKRRILHLVQFGLNQKEIAGEIGISQPAVSQHLRQPVFRLVMQTQKVIEEEIGRLLKVKS